jgi:hypothetical protein
MKRIRENSPLTRIKFYIDIETAYQIEDLSFMIEASLETSALTSSPGRDFPSRRRHRGCEHALPATAGCRIIEVICDGALTSPRPDGGAGTGREGAVDQPWRERLNRPRAEEEDRSYRAFGVAPASRLCCQILMSSGDGGLRVRLAPGSQLE